MLCSSQTSPWRLWPSHHTVSVIAILSVHCAALSRLTVGRAHSLAPVHSNRRVDHTMSSQCAKNKGVTVATGKGDGKRLCSRSGCVKEGSNRCGGCHQVCACNLFRLHSDTRGHAYMYTHARTCTQTQPPAHIRTSNRASQSGAICTARPTPSRGHCMVGAPSHVRFTITRSVQAWYCCVDSSA